MLDYTEEKYKEILRHNFTHPDYVMHLFNALLTSKNDIFRSMIQREKDKWELGEKIKPDSLVDKATTKYNNMVLQFEDVVDVASVLYPEFELVFLFDHSSGHKKKG